MKLKVFLAASLVAAYAHADDVSLHVTGAAGTLAQMKSSGWTAICTTPCDVRVDAGGLYRFVAPRGTDVNGSDEFKLPEGSSRVDLNVRAGLRSEYRIGVAILVISSLVVATGIGFIVGGSVLNAQNPGTNDGVPYVAGGLIGTILAGLVGVGGLVHMLNHRVSWIVMTPESATAALPMPRAFGSQLLSFDF